MEDLTYLNLLPSDCDNFWTIGSLDTAPLWYYGGVQKSHKKTFFAAMAPWSIPKKLGQNAIVSSTLNYIKPTNHWREIYPNDYRQTRLQFKVEGLEQDAQGKNVLKLSHVCFPNKTFTAFVKSVKLEQPGPPNQFFNNDGQQRLVSRAILANDDAEEDCKPIEDAAKE